MNMEKEQERSPLISVDADNDANVTLQVCKQEIKSEYGTFQEWAVCLLVNDAPVVLNKTQAERLAGQLRRLSKRIDELTPKTMFDLWTKHLN